MEWIKVSDWTSEEGKYFLVTDGEKIALAYLNRYNVICPDSNLGYSGEWLGGDFTHCMPLPELPKQDDGQE